MDDKNSKEKLYQGYRLPLYPTEEQEEKLQRILNAKIKIYNWAWETQKTQLENNEKVYSIFPLQKLYREFAKKDDEFRWMLGVIPDHIAYYAIDDLNNQIKRYLTKRARTVNFKSVYDNRKTFSQRNDIILLKNGKVQISRVGMLKTDPHMYQRVPPIESKYQLSGVRITYDGLKYYISFNLEIEPKDKVDEGRVIGIDLGIINLMATSDGYISPRPDPLVDKYEKKLRRAKRQAGRLYESKSKSRNLGKVEKEARRLEQKIKNILEDNINKEVSKLIQSKPKAIVMEDLDVQGMMRNRYVSRQLTRAKFRYIRDQVQYQCERNGIDFVLADRNFPSTKMCSSCGNVKPKMNIGLREYNCEVCGLSIDRDLNASLNLKNLYE